MLGRPAGIVNVEKWSRIIIQTPPTLRGGLAAQIDKVVAVFSSKWLNVRTSRDGRSCYLSGDPLELRKCTNKRTAGAVSFVRRNELTFSPLWCSTSAVKSELLSFLLSGISCQKSVCLDGILQSFVHLDEPSSDSQLDSI